MRRIIVSMNVTLDGYMAGPNCELDWHFRYWNNEMARFAGIQLSEADTILLGRVTYKAMEKYWPVKTSDPELPREDIAFTDMMNNHKKIVFSNTIKKADWNNSVIIRKKVRETIENLKREQGKNIIVFGSGMVVQCLMNWQLVDSFRLWYHPVYLGKGKPLFCNKEMQGGMHLAGIKVFSSGVVAMDYQSTFPATQLLMDHNIAKLQLSM